MQDLQSRVYQLIKTWANTNNRRARYAIDRIYEITDPYKLTQFVFNHTDVFKIDQLTTKSNIEIKNSLVNTFQQLAYIMAPNENNGIRLLSRF